jgi:hypothetical protein
LEDEIILKYSGKKEEKLTAAMFKGQIVSDVSEQTED